MTQRVFIFGAGGMLGRAVQAWFTRGAYRVMPLDKEQFDIMLRPFHELAKVISKGDWIVNCAGLIKAVLPAHSPEQAMRINGEFPCALAEAAAAHGAACIHISTDAVFSGRKGNYLETDAIEAEDLYARSKAAGETPLCMTLRTSIVGEERGSANSLLEWARSKRGGRVDGYTNHYWNGLSTLYLAQTIEAIFRTGKYKPGIFHLHSPDSLSKYELLKLIGEIYELKLEVRPTAAESACDRRLSSIHTLSADLVKVPIRQQLAELRKFVP